MAEEDKKSFLEETDGVSDAIWGKKAKSAGDAVWSTFVWDDELPWWANTGLLATSAVSLFAAAPSGGTSVAAGVGFRALVAGALKGGAKIATKEALKEGAKATVEMTGKAAAKVAGATGRYLAGSTPRWASWGLTAVGVSAPLLFNKIENESGGAITQKVIEEAVGGIKEGIKDGTITKENLEDGVRDAISIADMMSSADTMGHTAAVMAAIGKTENPAPEDLQRGKAAAIGWVVAHPVMPMTRLMLRTAAAEDLYPDQAEKERYIAQGFVNDLISAARIAPLEKHNAAVTEADIKAVLREHKQKGHLDEVLKHCPALERGLKDLYPDLFIAQSDPVAKPTVKATTQAGAQASVAQNGPAVETPKQPVVATPVPQPAPQANTPSTPDLMNLDVSGLKGPDLSAAFDKATKDFEGSHTLMGWFASKAMGLAKGISSLFNEFGMNEIADGFDRFVLRMAKNAVMISQFGDRFNLDNLKNLVPDLKKPEAGLIPAPAP